MDAKRAITEHEPPKTIVMVFGVFDVLHPGHLAFFEEAKSHGDELVVVVTPDARVIEEKGRAPALSAEDRMTVLRALSVVDRVIEGDTGPEWTCVVHERPDVICVGHDQRADYPAFLAQLVELPKKPEICKVKAKNRGKWASSLLSKRG